MSTFTKNISEQMSGRVVEIDQERAGLDHERNMLTRALAQLSVPAGAVAAPEPQKALGPAPVQKRPGKRRTPTKALHEQVLKAVAKQPGIKAGEMAGIGGGRSVYRHLSQAVAAGEIRRDGHRYFPVVGKGK